MRIKNIIIAALPILFLLLSPSFIQALEPDTSSHPAPPNTPDDAPNTQQNNDSNNRPVSSELLTEKLTRVNGNR